MATNEGPVRLQKNKTPPSHDGEATSLEDLVRCYMGGVGLGLIVVFALICLGAATNKIHKTHERL